MSKDERRELVLEAAMREFAITGLHGTSGEAIAERAGISQPYLFRLFGTKRELFIAVVNRAFDGVFEALTTAAEGSDPQAVLSALEAAFGAALAEHGGELLQMQLYAACGDDEVRFAVRRRFADCYRYIERVSGAPAEEVRAVFADAVLRSVAAAMRLSELPSSETWARRMLGSSG
ncbi:MAG TPA: helix-turn-helix domain-containing protein [Thermoleophilaceae bacterium]|jgi:AcrR family transcriptional regulator